ncbi:MAG: hypothetical protein NC253_01145 [Ruminococcus sp.]|nr:hypothetical protein [Ruminococcus sp.]
MSNDRTYYESLIITEDNISQHVKKQYTCQLIEGGSYCGIDNIYSIIDKTKKSNSFKTTKGIIFEKKEIKFNSNGKIRYRTFWEATYSNNLTCYYSSTVRMEDY